jgi:GNAT superfamily N-acetyltransferase
MPSELSTPDVLTAVTAATLARTQAVMADTTAWAAVHGLPSPPHDLPLYAAHGPAAPASAAFSADTVWYAQAWAAAFTLLHGERSSRSGRVCVARGEDRWWAIVVYPPGSDEEWHEVVNEVERMTENEVDASGRTLLLSPWRTPDLRGRGWELAGYPVLLNRKAGDGGREAPAPPDLVLCRAGQETWPECFVTPADLAVDVTGMLAGPWQPAGEVLYWSARYGGETVGVAAVVLAQGLWIPAAIAVHPDVRGQGIGRAMLALLRPHLIEFPGRPSLALAPDHLAGIARAAGYRARQRWVTWRKRGS